MKHVAVLMGGWSAEREVSLRSGKAAPTPPSAAATRAAGIDVGRDIATVLRDLNPDAALNLLHGRPGEDGTLQGLLEVAGVPYRIRRARIGAGDAERPRESPSGRAGIPVPKASSSRASMPPQAHPMPGPMSSSRSRKVRASVFSSSPRTTRIHRRSCSAKIWPSAIGCCGALYPRKELTCAVVREEATGVIEIVPKVRFYDYEANTRLAGRSTCYPLKFYQKFTKRSEDWLCLRIALWLAGA